MQRGSPLSITKVNWVAVTIAIECTKALALVWPIEICCRCAEGTRPSIVYISLENGHIYKIAVCMKNSSRIGPTEIRTVIQCETLKKASISLHIHAQCTLLPWSSR